MTDGRFGDLRARVLSALAMLALGGVALWSGGHVLTALVTVLAGLMAWEFQRMQAPGATISPEAFGAAAAILVAVFTWTWGGFVSMAGLAIGAGLLAARAPRDKGVSFAYLLMILWAAHGLSVLRDVAGLWVVLWLILIVIGSDVAGYFAGRILGGPKFWPRISPKKTWSGTVAGWLLAAVIGWLFRDALDMPLGLLVALSVALAFAGQMGDIAESALKRRAGIKDSSGLIPGHGGVLDRFDAMIAVAALALVMLRLGLLGV
jgi:phosphatidate cytidylyltransferase